MVQSSSCCCRFPNRQVARAAAAEGGRCCGATKARQAQAPDQLPVPRRQAEGKLSSYPGVSLLIRCFLRLSPSDLDVDLDAGTCQLGLWWMRSHTQSLLPCAGTGDAERPGQLDQNKAGDAGKVWLVMRCNARSPAAGRVIVCARSHARSGAEYTVRVRSDCGICKQPHRRLLSSIHAAFAFAACKIANRWALDPPTLMTWYAVT